MHVFVDRLRQDEIQDVALLRFRRPSDQGNVSRWAAMSQSTRQPFGLREAESQSSAASSDFRAHLTHVLHPKLTLNRSVRLSSCIEQANDIDPTSANP